MSARTDQLSAAEVRQMSHEEIAEAHDAGRLSEYMAGRDPGAPSTEPFTPPAGADQGAQGKTFASFGDWVRSHTPEEIDRLHREGHLDEYLRGEVD